MATNANIILSGIDSTTAPKTETFQDAEQQVATTAGVQAQTKSQELDNRLREEKMDFTSSLGKINAGLAQAQPVPGPDGITSIVPKGESQAFKIKNGWYVNDDGAPMSAYESPMYKIDNTLNPYSQKTIDEQVKALRSQGKPEYLIQDYYKTATENAIKQSKDLQSMQSDQYAILDKQQAMAKKQHENVANQAFDITSAADPHLALLHQLQLNPILNQELGVQYDEQGNISNSDEVLATAKHLGLSSPALKDAEANAKAHADNIDNENKAIANVADKVLSYDKDPLKAITMATPTDRQALKDAGYDPDRVDTIAKLQALRGQSENYLKRGENASKQEARGAQADAAEARAKLAGVQTDLANLNVQAKQGQRDAQQPIAQQVANYQLDISKIPSAQREQVAVLAKEINPDYDATKYATKQRAKNDFATGKQGQNVTSLNTAVNHLVHADSLIQALDNGDLKLVNQIGNWLADQTGKPAPTNFKMVKDIALDEVSKVVVGGPTAVADREHMQSLVAAANSPTQLRDAIKQAKWLMAGRLDPLRLSYENATGLKDFDTMIAPESKKAMAEIHEDGSNQTTTSNSQAGSRNVTLKDGRKVTINAKNEVMGTW